MSELEVIVHVLGVVMTQYYSLIAGIIFRNDGEATVTKELSQLHDMNTFTPVNGSNLSKEENKDAIT